MIPQANPLLPPDKHVDDSPASAMLIYNTPAIKLPPAKNPTTLTKISTHSYKEPKKKVNEIRKLVYKRINNEKLNILNRTQYRFLNSVFVELKFLVKQSFSYDMIASAGLTIEGPVSFNSKFQSGNLLHAYRTSSEQYQLMLQNDINTKGHPQWFFFELSSNMPLLITLNITNMGKLKSLFQEGMQPFTFDGHWKRANIQKINYFENKNKKQHQYGLYSTLKMTLKLDTKSMLIAYSIPYTLKRMQDLIKKAGSLFHVQTLCHSVSGRQIRLLSGGNKKQPIIWVIARQHPGQSPGSLLFEGFLNKIIQQPQVLQQYYFKLVPMVNPDGVVTGNYRTNLAGIDLNRKWIHPSLDSTPEIHTLKSAIMETKQKTAFFIDCHSHSRNQGTFFYGMNNDGKGKQIYSQMFPYLVSKMDKRFCIKNCSFIINPSKLSTARSVVGREIRGFAYTVETSFHGYYDEKDQLISYSQQDYLEMGKSMMEGLRQMKSYVMVRKFNYPKTEGKLKDGWKYILGMEKQLKFRKFHFNIDSGSDSNPEEGQLTRKQRETLYKAKDRGFLITNSSNPSPIRESFLGQVKKGNNRYSNFRSKIQDIYMKRSNYETGIIDDDFQEKNSFSEEQDYRRNLSLHKEESFSKRYFKQRQDQMKELERDVTEKQIFSSPLVSDKFKNAIGKLRVKNEQLQFRLKKINFLEY